MKSAEEILLTMAQAEGYKDVQDWLINAGCYNQEEIIVSAMQQYALACLQKAAEKAKLKNIDYSGIGLHSGYYVVDKESITNPDNLV